MDKMMTMMMKKANTTQTISAAQLDLESSQMVSR